jgi:hypothetical protein
MSFSRNNSAIAPISGNIVHPVHMLLQLANIKLKILLITQIGSTLLSTIVRHIVTFCFLLVLRTCLLKKEFYYLNLRSNVGVLQQSGCGKVIENVRQCIVQIVIKHITISGSVSMSQLLTNGPLLDSAAKGATAPGPLCLTPYYTERLAEVIRLTSLPTFPPSLHQPAVGGHPQASNL